MSSAENKTTTGELRFRDVPLIFKGENYIIVDKPAGLSVHNKEDPQNLLDVLAVQLGVKSIYPAHRLDKETSGLQILALNNSWAQKLAKEFEEARVQKIYVGLLRGVLSPPAGSWNRPLTDKAEGRKNPAGAPGQQVPCETRYEVLQSNKYFTLCRFDLITGRQHQIRKHAALAKHALVGDPRYGDPKYNQKMAEIYKTGRMFLHCQKLTILDRPFESPLPQEFRL